MRVTGKPIAGRGVSRRTCSLVAGLACAVLVAGALAPARALASGGHGGAEASGESGSGGAGETSGSGSSGGSHSGGGLGSRLKSAGCGLVGSIPFIGGAAAGLAGCDSSGGGSVDPVQATSSILQRMFAGLGVAAGPLLVPTLAQVPDYSGQGGGVDRLRRYTSAIGFALLGLVATLSVMRFWLAGMSLSGSGGFEAAQGITRTAAAALAIVSWPWAFHNLAAVANLTTHALLDAHAVRHALEGLLGLNALALVLFAAGSKIPKLGGIGWIFGVIVLGLQAVLIVGLVLLKVALSASTTVIFVGMPLMLASWPLPETGWIAGRALRVLFVAVCTPLIWALLFAATAVMTGSAFGLHGSGILDKLLIDPLAAMSMFILACWVPIALLRHTHGSTGTHPVGRLAGYMGVRLASNAVSEHIPTRLGGRRHPVEPFVPLPEPAPQLTLMRSPERSTHVTGRPMGGAGEERAAQPIAAFGAGEPPARPDSRETVTEADGRASADPDPLPPAGGRPGAPAAPDGPQPQPAQATARTAPVLEPPSVGNARVIARELERARAARYTIDQGRDALARLPEQTRTELRALHAGDERASLAATLANSSLATGLAVCLSRGLR